MLCVEGVPGLPGAPQDDAGLTRKFEMSHVCCATCRTTPISPSALEMNPIPGHLFEGNPVDEGKTRKGLSPQSEKSRPWSSFLWAGLTTASASATPITASSPKPAQ